MNPLPSCSAYGSASPVEFLAVPAMSRLPSRRPCPLLLAVLCVGVALCTGFSTPTDGSASCIVLRDLLRLPPAELSIADAEAFLQEASLLLRAGSVEPTRLVAAVGPLLLAGCGSLETLSAAPRKMPPWTPGLTAAGFASCSHPQNETCSAEIRVSSPAQHPPSPDAPLPPILKQNESRSAADCAVLQQLNIFTLNTSFSNASCLVACCSCSEVRCNSAGSVTSLSVLPAAGTVPASTW